MHLPHLWARWCGTAVSGPAGRPAVLGTRARCGGGGENPVLHRRALECVHVSEKFDEHASADQLVLGLNGQRRLARGLLVEPAFRRGGVLASLALDRRAWREAGGRRHECRDSEDRQRASSGRTRQGTVLVLMRARILCVEPDWRQVCSVAQVLAALVASDNFLNAARRCDRCLLGLCDLALRGGARNICCVHACSAHAAAATEHAVDRKRSRRHCTRLLQ